MSSIAADDRVVDEPVGQAGPIAVRLAGVAKRFGETTALWDTDLSVRRGELLTLLGPSGCGKTTLLNLVAGFFAPDAGTIEIDGRHVNELPTHKRDTGVMFQSYALFPHMTVAANVGYGLEMRGVARTEITRRVGDALALVKLPGLEQRRPSQLSGGQQQRVALARALVIEPKVLLLDEPFSALDKNLRASMQVEIKEIQRKLGVTTIFVTHDQSEALSLSDRMVVMSDGRICQIGTPDEVYHRPADRFVASFVGDVNVLSARLERIDRGQAIVAIGAARLGVPAGPLADASVGGIVDLFVRPEQLRFAAADDPVALDGVVAAHVYQGDHVDFHVAVAEAASGRILMRVAGRDAIRRWPVGTQLQLAISDEGGVAFRAGG